MSGWQFKVVTKRRDGPGAGHPMVETYAAHFPGKADAWAAVAKEVAKADPLARVEALGAVPEAMLLAEGIALGQVKLTDRTL